MDRHEHEQQRVGHGGHERPDDDHDDGQRCAPPEADEPAAWWQPAMQRRLTAFARRFVGDRGEAEDVAQETLLRAAASRVLLRRCERAEAWLFRICRHAAIDLVRSRRVRRGVWGLGHEGILEGAAAQPPRRQPPAPAASLGALDDVGAHHRLLLDLHYRKGLSQALLCRLTGLNASALRVRLYRARRALAERVGGRPPDPGKGPVKARAVAVR